MTQWIHTDRANLNTHLIRFMAHLVLFLRNTRPGFMVFILVRGIISLNLFFLKPPPPHQLAIVKEKYSVDDNCFSTFFLKKICVSVIDFSWLKFMRKFGLVLSVRALYSNRHKEDRWGDYRSHSRCFLLGDIYSEVKWHFPVTRN